MKANSNHVIYTFPAICDCCDQEEYDNKSERVWKDQKATVFSLIESGIPLCQICDSELQLSSLCEVQLHLETDKCF